MSIIDKISCDSVEHFTPANIVEAAREAMGGIDLDPASSHIAQETVLASKWCGDAPNGGAGWCGEDGLKLDWSGRTFLNPPGGLVENPATGFRVSSAGLWWEKLVRHWVRGEVVEAIFVGFNIEVLRVTQSCVLSAMHFPFCIPKSRIPFDTTNRIRERGKKKGQLICPDKPLGARVKGESPVCANVIVHLPRLPYGPGTDPMVRFDDSDFRQIFSQFGEVL